MYDSCEEEFRDLPEKRKGRRTKLAKPQMHGDLGGLDRISEDYEKLREFSSVKSIIKRAEVGLG